MLNRKFHMTASYLLCLSSLCCNLSLLCFLLISLSTLAYILRCIRNLSSLSLSLALLVDALSLSKNILCILLNSINSLHNTILSTKRCCCTLCISTLSILA